MDIKLRYITDPGHGWLEVPKSLLVELAIQDKITDYSYQKGTMAYLEEDCDAYEFVQACKAQGINVEFDDVYEERTAIRHYQRFAA